VIVLHVGAVKALELKDQLLDAGLKLDQDFTWEYNQAHYDNDSWHAVIPRQVKFSFVDPSLATFFKLKWT
jgi:hypothetical protein